MEEYENDMEGETPEGNSLYINGINYSYSIYKADYDEKILIIKFYDSANESNNIYYTYEGDVSKFKKDIQFLESFNNLDEINLCLNDIFNKGNAQVEEKNDEYKLKLLYIKSGINKSSYIHLIKHDKKERINDELEGKLNRLEKNYKDLYNKYEELKVIKGNEIRTIVKEVILDKEKKLKLFEDMEQMFLSKYNLNTISKNQKRNEIIEDDITNKVKEIVNNKEDKINEIKEVVNNKEDKINKIKEVVNNKEDKINNQINISQQQLNENINDINNIKSKNNDNYIRIQVNIEKKNLKKDIILFNQIKNNNNYNFERKDIEAIIDNKIVDIIFKDDKCYYNFTKKGLNTIRIRFKKKLIQCNHLFDNCNNIYKIDCSHFDCSQIIDCSWMFSNCSSLIEINLGKISFGLSKNFAYMFFGCNNLEKLDVSYLNTNNSKSFEGMFHECSKIKEINVSKFKTTNCENISFMFYHCSSLESIDMLNWDMKNINNITYLFGGCRNLKNIKMNFNNDKKLSFGGTFLFLPEGGSFVWKKGTSCKEVLINLPISWNKTQE